MELLLGCLAGFLIGATGVGGGLLTAPALMLLFGAPPQIGIGTALVFLTAARLYAGLLYLLRGHVVWKVLRGLLLGGVPGALAGPWLSKQLALHARPGALLLSVGVIVVLSASLSLASFYFRRTRAATPRPALLPLAGLIIGTALGLSSAGAGSLGAMTLFHLTDLEPASVVGTDLAAGLVLSLTAGAIYVGSGAVSGSLLWKLVLGGLVGVFAGVRLGSRLPATKLRTAILAWALVLGTILIGQGFRECLS